MQLMLKVVVAAVLLGAVAGCSNFPFLGRNQSSNQVEASPNTAQSQSATRNKTLRAKQPTKQAKNNTRATAQAPDATIDPEAPGNTQAVPALW